MSMFDELHFLNQIYLWGRETMVFHYDDHRSHTPARLVSIHIRIFIILIITENPLMQPIVRVEFLVRHSRYSVGDGAGSSKSSRDDPYF